MAGLSSPDFGSSLLAYVYTYILYLICVSTYIDISYRAFLFDAGLWPYIYHAWSYSVHRSIHTYIYVCAYIYIYVCVYCMSLYSIKLYFILYSIYIILSYYIILYIILCYTMLCYIKFNYIIWCYIISYYIYVRTYVRMYGKRGNKDVYAKMYIYMHMYIVIYIIIYSVIFLRQHFPPFPSNWGHLLKLFKCPSPAFSGPSSEHPALHLGHLRGFLRQGENKYYYPLVI